MPFRLFILALSGLFIASNPGDTKTIIPVSELREICTQDFSELLIPETEFLGFIGEDKQRIYMVFDSLQKVKGFDNQYQVFGHSTVFDNRCDFSGILLIENYQVLSSDEKSTEYPKRFQLSGTYKLAENPHQKHVGLFEGQFRSHFIRHKDSQVKRGLIDPFRLDRNHQYQGIWREYGSEKSKVCNWGELRIPGSGDLDLGLHGFSPNPKYQNKGW